MLYRIYAGHVVPMVVARILTAHGIKSFSIISQEGYWQGVPESSLVIEIIDEKGDMGFQIFAAAETIRAEGGQDVVYVLHIPIVTMRSIVSEKS